MNMEHILCCAVNTISNHISALFLFFITTSLTVNFLE